MLTEPLFGGMMPAGLILVMSGGGNVTGPETILEGLRGIPRLFAGVENVEPMVNDFRNGGWYAVQGRIVKPFLV